MKTLEISMYETFGIRPREIYIISDERLDNALMLIKALPCAFPDDNFCPLTEDGVDVKQAAIVACDKNDKGEWQWVNLTPFAKRMLGDLIFDNGGKSNTWYSITKESNDGEK